MSDGNFSDFISRERDRLQGERDQIIEEQRGLKQKLDELDREMTAIMAYESAKTGKATRGGSSNGPSGGARQARRGSKREELLKVIGEGGGISRGDILDRMGLKGDKSGEMSVSNALTALTKNGQVVRDGGKYSLAA